MIDLGDALTRKLGPLPTWAWAGVVGVGALAYKALRGPAPQNGSSGKVQTIGGDGALDYGDLPDLSPGGSGAYQTPTSTVGGDTLPGVFGQIGSAFTLQQQLNDALAKLASLLGQRSSIQTQQNALLDSYRAGKISKATYTAQRTKLNSQLTTVNTQITSQNGLIADLRARLAAIFAAPAAA